MAVGTIVALQPTVLLPVVIDAESADDNNQPGRERPLSVHRISAKPGEVISLELVEDELVCVHDRVGIAILRSQDVQDEVTVPFEKGRPCCGTRVRVGRPQQTVEFFRNGGTHANARPASRAIPMCFSPIVRTEGTREGEAPAVLRDVADRERELW